MNESTLSKIMQEAAHQIWCCAVDSKYGDAKECAKVAINYLNIVIFADDLWQSQMKCPACVQRPRMRYTGWGEKMACPVCHFEFDPSNPDGLPKFAWGGKAYVPQKYRVTQ